MMKKLMLLTLLCIFNIGVASAEVKRPEKARTVTLSEREVDAIQKAYEAAKASGIAAPLLTKHVALIVKGNREVNRDVRNELMSEAGDLLQRDSRGL